SQEVSVKMNTAAQMAVNPTVNHGPDQSRNLVSRTDPPPNVLAAIIDTANAATLLPSPRLIGTSYRAANLPMLTASARPTAKTQTMAKSAGLIRGRGRSAAPVPTAAAAITGHHGSDVRKTKKSLIGLLRRAG